MKFSELVEGLDIAHGDDFEVAGIALDSREMRQDYIFFALKGEKTDGADYAAKAIAMGARAVFSETALPADIGSNVYTYTGNKARKLMGIISVRFFSPLPKYMAAVTGTNGKTSTVNFTAALIKHCGYNSAGIGTLGTLLDGDFNKQFSYSGLTSPDIISLLKDLQALKNKGINYVTMEASSHGLHQQRLGGVKFQVGAFNNFTQDHLDYHGDMESYFDAKALLFTQHIQDDGIAVLNADMPEYERLKEICAVKNIKVFSYGMAGEDIKIKSIRPHDNGLDVDCEIAGRNRLVTTSLLGGFQAYNVTCAIGILICMGFETEKVVAACSKLVPVKGRMDIIPFERKKAKIVIDYAHTPDALEKAIASLRVHTSGKLVTMFGCGGDRDKAKRPQMGKIAVDGSDVVIVTDDNPRTEDAADIRAQIMAAAPNATEVAGRRQAIEQAIAMLDKGDSLLLAGKGHEDYQVVGEEKLPFDEFRIVREIIGI